MLRVGVIGLGRRWQKRYRPALLKLQDRFEVRVLCDEIAQRALNEAYRLGCDAAAGPTELLESDDLDAVLLLDPGWYRLWPLEAACRAGKPVFCCPMPDLDEPHAGDLFRQVEESRLPVMLEMALRFAPAMVALRELLETRLGSARVILGEIVQPARAAPRGLLGASGVGLLDACADLLGGEPVNVQAAGAAEAALGTLFLDFGDGRMVQITRWRGPGARRALRLRVVAERGTAMVELPDRLSWSDAGGRHTRVLRGQPPLGQVLLGRFHQAITQGQTPRPGLADAYRVLDWLGAADRSGAEHQENRP